LRAGIIASAVINHSFCPPKEPIEPNRFVPDWDGGAPEKKKEEDFDLRKLSPEAQKMWLIDLFSKKEIVNGPADMSNARILPFR